MLVALALQGLAQGVVFGLQLGDPVAQAQDDVGPGDVDAEFADQAADQPQAGDVGLREEALASA